jgi:hypothetical protein
MTQFPSEKYNDFCTWVGAGAGLGCDFCRSGAEPEGQIQLLLIIPMNTFIATTLRLGSWQRSFRAVVAGRSSGGSRPTLLLPFTPNPAGTRATTQTPPSPSTAGLAGTQNRPSGSQPRCEQRNGGQKKGRKQEEGRGWGNRGTKGSGELQSREWPALLRSSARPHAYLRPPALTLPSPPLSFHSTPHQAEVARAKHFSSCTVPMVIYSYYSQTFGEYFTGPPVWMWRMQARSSPREGRRGRMQREGGGGRQSSNSVEPRASKRHTAGAA